MKNRPPSQLRFSHQLIRMAAALVALIVIGLIGYRWLEGLDFVDALYMTVITLTTVGFGEVKTFSPAGRIFTVALIMGGVSIAAYALSNIAQYVLSGEWEAQLQARRRRRALDHLQKHIIVCGYGRVGKGVVHELVAEKLPFVVIDSAAEKVTHVQAQGHLALLGNAADEHLLQAAGIERAAGLVVCVNSDAENVYIVLTAHGLRPDLNIVARANYEESESKLLRAGAKRVMLPFNIAGRRMVTMLVRPDVADFIDVVSHASGLELLVEQVQIEPSSPLCGHTLAEVELGAKVGISVLACRMPNGQLELRPTAETRIVAGAGLIVLGTLDQLQDFMRLVR